jgi:hypothetical protein
MISRKISWTALSGGIPRSAAARGQYIVLAISKAYSNRIVVIMAKIVWIPKAAGHAFQEAHRFGELRFIYDEYDNAFSVDELQKKAHRVLREFKLGDYLLLSGPILMNCLVFAEVASQHTEFNILLFHARLMVYMERTIRNDRA